MSTILKHLTAGLPQLNLDGKAKTPEVAFGKAEQEHVVVFREGELLQVYAKSIVGDLLFVRVGLGVSCVGVGGCKRLRLLCGGYLVFLALFQVR